ncbi:MAG: D-amino acid dehydrogenase, partial [Alphaproteobacteria bacterium]|nr:D-amino acid dehydrogenase [Alphaproteobacteria bacterium]
MKALVLGAGVVGVAAAWYLARAGVAVTVVERRPGAGLETSFANGGQISASHAEPWANPDTPAKALKWMGREDAPLVFRWRRRDPALWAWGLRFLTNCTTRRAAINTERTLRIALYSRARLKALRAETGIAYEQREAGILHVYRDPREFAHARRAAELMSALGLARRALTPDQCRDLEPALSTIHGALAGGLHSPDDESGDAHLFTARLAEMAAAQGVEFKWETNVLGLLGEAGRVAGVITDRGTLTADAYVLAAGSWSPLLARGLGLRLPIYPAKGYSATIPIADPAGAPTISITDDENKLVFSRLGERLRAAGTAELTGWDATLNDYRARLVLEKTKTLFPRAGGFERAELWAGLRPVTPDSVPLLGRTPYPNLWLDTGHGTLGWTMACGSGAALADLITG